MKSSLQLQRVLTSVALAAFVWFTSVHNLVILAIIGVVVVELPTYRRLPTKDELRSAVPELAAGLSAALLIALYPREVSQIALALAYAGWRYWLRRVQPGGPTQIVATLVNQVLVFESLFLMAAIWQTNRVVILILLWLTSFGLVYTLLRSRDDRSAAVLAAAWALVVCEAAWVFLSWLVSYVIAGGYVVVPQPTIVLGGLAYCAGSIYLAQRQGRLSRTRLSEYLAIALVLIVIVIAGTGWRGTV
jgi:hypothetical protein